LVMERRGRPPKTLTNVALEVDVKMQKSCHFCFFNVMLLLTCAREGAGMGDIKCFALSAPLY
jgi:hypothetical protein